MKDDLRYTPSDCFETFPFPQKSEQEHPAVIAMGQVYHQYRAELMIKNDHGLTATYNRFHDPDEQSPDILKLRELHAEMDRAVLTAYGWTDLAERATCEFRLDYEDDDESSDDEAPRARAKKKPWRYRWPQDFHDEVLARLLDLNQQRAEEERLAGAAANTGTGTTKKGPASPRKKPSARQAAPILALPFAPVAAQEAPTTVRTTSEEPTQRPLVLPEVQRPTRVTVLGKLVLILCDLFPRDDDFRHWVRDIEPELRMWVDLPGSGSPLRALIQDGIDLFDRHGLLTPEFIGRLRRDHPSAAHGFHEIAIGLFDHSDDLDTIQMVAPKDEQQSLAARLDLLYKQHRQRAIEAQDCSDLEQQIRAIRKELRSPTFHAGDWLGNGRFRLTHYSGKGGFATVWQAYDRDIGTPAAVKLLHPHILNDATERNRFIRGSRIMAALNHPHIARIRRSATNEDGHYYYAMDYLPNGDLNDAVTAGKINLRQRLAIVADVAEAMAYAHRLNIIHRDIKPSNILIDAEHHGILSDFDLVRAPGTEGGTRTNNMLGSLYYAAPEALNFSVPVSTQSDVYSLGMVLLFCLVGQNFTTKEALVNPETLLEPLPIPAPLKSMVQSCLAYAANDRTITMSDIHQHLIRYLNS